MQFNDLYYLYFDVDGLETVVELTTVGTEHTGVREMAIRKSDAVILCYAAHSPISFHELSSVADDFTMRKKYVSVFNLKTLLINLLPASGYFGLQRRRIG